MSRKSASPVTMEDFPAPLFCQLCDISPKSKRRVTFSSTCEEITFYEHRDDAADLHYSRDDYRAMKAAKKRAVEEERRRRRLALPPSSNVGPSPAPTGEGPEDFERALNGIENLVSPELTKKMLQDRFQCMRAVSGHQRRQAISGVYDPHELARASRCHSEWAAKRAFVVGMLQSMNAIEALPPFHSSAR